MNNQPVFSVITPVYNREGIVGSTIESVLNQSFKNFEYILVDDCSEDKSLDILRKFEKEDERIRVISLSKNEGRCFARNKGLEVANAEWICYLDSDDLFYDNHLEVMHEMISSHPEFKAFAVDQHINEELKEYKNKHLHEDALTMGLEDFVENNPLTANQLCHRKIDSIKWSNERIPISEDWLFMRNLSNQFPILKRKIVTTNLIEHNDRSMNTLDSHKFVTNNLKAAKKFIDENNLPSSIKNRIEVYTELLCANVYLDDKKKKEGRKLLMKHLLVPRAYTYKLLYRGILKSIM